MITSSIDLFKQLYNRLQKYIIINKVDQIFIRICTENIIRYVVSKFIISHLINMIDKSINLFKQIYDNFNITKVDSIIVGAGIVGTSLAYQISSYPNQSILLIDKETVGSGASGLSAGTIYSPFDQIPEINYEKSNDYIKSYLSIGTINIIKSINRKIDCNFSQPGSITLGTDKTKKYISDLVNNGIQQGHNIKLLESKNLYAPSSAQVNPEKLVNAFAKLAMDNGTTILNGTYIKKIKYNKDNYRITLNNEKDYLCKNLILTNGTGINQVTNMIGIHVPIIPVKGTIWNAEISDYQNQFPNIIFSSNSYFSWGKYPTLNITNNIPHNCTHDKNGNIINHRYINLKRFWESIQYKDDLDIEHFYGKSYTDSNNITNVMFGFNRQIAKHDNDYFIDEHLVHKCFNKIKKIFPILEHTQINNYWCGIMPVSLHDKPIVGNFNCFGYPNMWIANGFGAHGIAMAPMTTKLLANKIIGIENQDTDIILKKFNIDDCSLIK